jgi:DNA polymerase-3 subunit delta
MITLVYGKESFQVYEKTNEIIKESKGLVVFLDSFEKLSKEISQRSIFQEKKLIVLSRCLDSSFLPLLDKVKDSQLTNILFKEEKVDKKTDVFFKKNGETFFFDLLKQDQVVHWIVARVKKRKGEIEKEAAFLLAQLVVNDLWLASNEIEKLLAYSSGKIKKQEVVLLTSPSTQGDIFKAIDFLASRNKKATFDFFYRHIKKGDHVLYLLTMINYQFRNLLLIKMSPGKSARELGLHPFVFQKSLKLAGLFSEKEIKENYRKIFQTEINIKTGKATPEAALDSLLIELLAT